MSQLRNCKTVEFKCYMNFFNQRLNQKINEIVTLAAYAWFICFLDHVFYIVRSDNQCTFRSLFLYCGETPSWLRWITTVGSTLDNFTC